jgi:hydroxymethylglutaryl-CoA reductase
MAILSNFNPDCIVECSVKCNTQQLQEISGNLSAIDFAKKFETAVSIANIDIYRAATHNKGIFNGIDAVVIATGNDFRAIEAGGHAYAASNGTYRSLSSIETNHENFKFSLKVPISLGTVGGITNVHPLAQTSLKILDYPSAMELMQIAASVGLANNFSAIRALISTGIQKGHMKLHLSNILKSFDANDFEKEKITSYFKNKTVSFSESERIITDLRNNKPNA